MSTEIWNEGVIVEFLNGEPCKRAMIRRLGKDEIVFADIEKGAEFRSKLEELNTMWAAGKLKLLADVREFGEISFVELSTAEQIEVNRRVKYLRYLKDNGVYEVTDKKATKLLQGLAEKLGEKAPHHSSVRRWHTSYMEAGGKSRGLYPKHRLKGNRKPKIDPRVFSFIQLSAGRYYDGAQRSMATIVRNVENRVRAHNQDNPGDRLNPPAYLTVQHHVLGRSYASRKKQREGNINAATAGKHSGIVTTRVLERVEIDHTELDIHLLHDDRKTLIGRPYLTILIDHYSHMVMGLQLSFEPPSSPALGLACLNAYLRKESFLSDLQINMHWPAHGIPETIVADNGKEFWSEYFEDVIEGLGTIVQYCPIREAWYKSRVERFFGILNSVYLDDKKGVVRKPGKSKAGYDPRQEAAMTYTEFKTDLLRWITEVFHREPIEDTDLTPYDLWTSSEDELSIPEESKENLSPILMKTDKRTLSRTGVEIYSLTYESAFLKDIFRRDGPCKIVVKSNPFDLGHVFVYDAKNKVYLRIDCSDYAYACGLSVYAHRLIRSNARKNRKSKQDDLDLNKAKVELFKKNEEVHARNRRRKTQSTTSQGARVEQVGVEGIKMVVDNTAQENLLDVELDGEELSTDGWYNN